MIKQITYITIHNTVTATKTRCTKKKSKDVPRNTRHSKLRHSNFKANTVDYEVEQKKGPFLKSKPCRIPVL